VCIIIIIRSVTVRSLSIVRSNVSRIAVPAGARGTIFR